MDGEQLTLVKHVYATLGSDDVRRTFLEHYLDDVVGLEPLTSAWVHEQLGLLASDRMKTGEYYKKAGFAWERVAMLHDRTGAFVKAYERYALQRAARLYAKAARAFDGTAYPGLAHHMRERVSEVRRQLRVSYGGFSRYATVLVTLFGFGLSLLFWTAQFTGLVIAEVTPEVGAMLGVVFFALGIVGLVIVVLRERV